MKKLGYVIFILLMSLPLGVMAQEYDITNYYVNVDVNENNIYSISEYYNLMFKENTQFSRNISLHPKVYLTSGKFISYITQVFNVKTDNEFNAEEDSKRYQIHFAPAEPYSSAAYVLSYDYNMGEDLDDDSDLVFVNLIDGTLDINSNEISFSLIIPTDIERDKVTFYENGKVIKDEKLIEYTIENNTINGVIHKKINEGDIISLHIQLPNNYFKNTVRTVSNLTYLLIIIPLCSLCLAVWALFKFKKGKYEDIDVADIPNRLDSMEVSYLYKGKAHASDMVSVLFHLANDGYISFKNNGGKGRINFKIRQEKKYDKDNAIQKIVYDGLFENKEEVNPASILGVFQPYFIDAKRTLDNKKNREMLFYPLVTLIKRILILIIYVGMMSLQITPLYNIIGNYIMAILGSLFVGMILTIPYKMKNKMARYILLWLSLLIIGFEISALLEFRLHLLVYIIGMLILEVSLFLEFMVPIRTVYGMQKREEMERFRIFLTGMSENYFDEMIEKDPNYFYKMLPYTIIFDLQAWWFHRFGSKVLAPPNWYISSEIYARDKLEQFIGEVIRQLTVSFETGKMFDDELLEQAPNKLL